MRKKYEMGGQVQSLDRFGVATILSLSVVWGLNPIIVLAALAEVGPFGMSGVRCAIACICIVGYAAATRRAIFHIDGTEAIGALLGLLYVAQFTALFESVRLTTLSHSIVFLYVAPLLVALGTTFLLKDERLRPVQWIGLSVAFLGVASELIGRWGMAHPAGDALALLAALLWASSTLLIKGTKLSRIEPTKTLLYQIGVAAIICPAAMWALGEPVPKDISTSTYASLIWQGAVVVGFTYTLWIWLLGRYPAAQLSAFGFVTPLVGVVAAAVVLDEPPTKGLVVAAALVMFGLVLVAWPPPHAASPIVPPDPG
jgi:drug/metabolite transporter (DMT)-like permease